MFLDSFLDLFYSLFINVIRRDRFEMIFVYFYFVEKYFDEMDKFIRNRFFIIRMNKNYIYF